MKLQRSFWIVFFSAVLSVQIVPADEPSQPLESLSLEELMQVKVVSASNTEERLSEAPATVIVITHEQMTQRGYTELSQILDDLPGMQMARPRGATYFKDYWRGFRNNIGEPFLVMIDGMIFNHLYFNTGDVLATFPLSNIDRVEVVYGPASSVYGANAFMGVINVITGRNFPEQGSHAQGAITGGSFDSRVADMNFFYNQGDLKLSMTARIDHGQGDIGTNNNYEYTKDSYYADRRLWGGFVDNPELGGSYDSPHRNIGIDVRGYLHWMEVGFEYFKLDAGYGSEYAADEVQNHAVWARPDWAIFMRARKPLSDRVSSSTLLRYRESDVSPDSYFLEGFNTALTRYVDFSYWQSLNHSWSVYQDFDVRWGDCYSFTTGLKYEQKNLQKAYDTVYGPATPAVYADPATYPFPTPFSATPIAQNRIETEDVGVYIQNKWRFRDGKHVFNFGIRNDHNSEYGSALTARGGYVGTFGKWGVKALFGNAFQEPTPRLLYGGWKGSGSDPLIDPEKSRTLELSASYTQNRYSGLFSFYDIRNTDTIVNVAAGEGTVGGAQNLGDRDVIGADLHGRVVFFPGHMRELQVWGYYSLLFRAREKKINQFGVGMGTERIGDLADHQLHLGVTGVINSHVNATLRLRWNGARPTVDTNPVRKVDSYTTADLSILGDDFGLKGLGFTIAITNLTDAQYFEPGDREASAGVTPGYFDASGLWHGSNGFFSSLLPQPGRSIQFMLRLDY